MKITATEKAIAKKKFPKTKGQAKDRTGANAIKNREKGVGVFSGEIGANIL